MEWITQINLGEYSTQLGALNQAKEIIAQWCKENNISGDIYRASKVNNNKNQARYLSLTTRNDSWYVYQLIISSYHKVIGTKEIDNLIQGFGKITSNVYDDKPTYFAKLKKVYNLNSLKGKDKEVLYVAK